MNFFHESVHRNEKIGLEVEAFDKANSNNQGEETSSKFLTKNYDIWALNQIFSKGERVLTCQLLTP